MKPSKTEPMTLDRILAERCIEVGNCWEWQAGVNSAGHPIMRFQGKTTLARRACWSLHHGFSLEHIEGLRLWTTCGNIRCVSPACTRMGSPLQMFKALAKTGRLKGHHTRRISSARVRQAASDLTMQDVRDIRAARAQGQTISSLAKQYGKANSSIENIIHHRTWRDSPMVNSVFALAGAL